MDVGVSSAVVVLESWWVRRFNGVMLQMYAVFSIAAVAALR